MHFKDDWIECLNNCSTYNNWFILIVIFGFHYCLICVVFQFSIGGHPYASDSNVFVITSHSIMVLCFSVHFLNVDPPFMVYQFFIVTSQLNWSRELNHISQAFLLSLLCIFFLLFVIIFFIYILVQSLLISFYIL